MSKNISRVVYPIKYKKKFKTLSSTIRRHHEIHLLRLLHLIITTVRADTVESNVIQLDVEGVGVVLARELERKLSLLASGDDGVVTVDVGVPGVGVVEGVKVVKVDAVELDQDVALVEGEVLSLGDVVPVAEGVGGAGDETGDGLGEASLLVALGPTDEAVVDVSVFV